MKRLVFIIPAAVLLATAVPRAQSAIATGPHDFSAGSALRNTSTTINGQTCVFCHKPIALFTHAQQPALRDPDGHTFDFAALPAEDLIARLPEFDPVCFDCHIAEQFRADYPERVLDRRF